MMDGKKNYYTISEVAENFNIAASVLRYWETQFKQLKPKKMRKRRYYTMKDIELVKRIYELLYERRMTIDGARKELSEQSINKCIHVNDDNKDKILLEIKKDLSNILEDL